MSQAHANDLTLMGDIDGFHHGSDGRIIGLVLRVDVGELAVIPIILDRPVVGFQKHDRVWLRGTIQSMKCPGSRYALVYVQPRHIEVIKRRTSAA